jgi:hypothetical protein
VLATDGAVPQHACQEKLIVPLTLKVGAKRTQQKPPVEGPAMKKLKTEMGEITQARHD